MKNNRPKKRYIKALVKVTSKREFAEDFRKGKLYMNELRYFVQCEEDEIGDPAEGRGCTTYIGNYTVNMINTAELCRPIFCMYGVYGAKTKDNYISISNKMQKFGEFAVVVTNIAEFFRRLKRAELEYGPVKYQDSHPNDLMSRIPYNPIFNKAEKYGHQREFRIVDPNLFLTKNSEEKIDTFQTVNDDHEEIIISEGLEDITYEIVSTQDIAYPNGLHIDLDVDWEKVIFEDYVHYEKPTY